MPGYNSIEEKAVKHAALLGSDYHGVHFEMLCQPGDEVAAGSPVMRDARRPRIKIASPVSGRLLHIERAARRQLKSLQFELDPSLQPTRHSLPEQQDAASLRQFLLDTGGWSLLRTRPFGNIPDADAVPAAIFVSAMDLQPDAPDPRLLVEAFLEEFQRAILVLAEISEATVYVCHSPGFRPELEDHARLRLVAFNGGPAAGLAGVHIQRLCPIGFAGEQVWQIDYQQAIALGHLLRHGSAWTQRVISISGDAIDRAHLLRVPPGAAIAELLEPDLDSVALEVLDASWLYGRRQPLEHGFLKAAQRQLTLRRSGVNASIDLPGKGVVIADERLESLAPPGIYAVPLMRALQLGDSERARQLGALELLEEDVAALSNACVSNNDYAGLLRVVLDDIEAGR